MAVLIDSADQVENLEVTLLLEGIYRRYALDFREYATASVARRLRYRTRQEHRSSISALQERVLRDPACMERLLLDLSINVTTMFRDPSFWAAFRAHVVPLLRTYPFLRVWSAGCATGEEAFSLAILLAEEGLTDRTRIYATDINEAVLERARSGTAAGEPVAAWEDNYRATGGDGDLWRWFRRDRDGLRLLPELQRSIVFAQHNLVSDRSFNDFHVVLCRNVMIYFGEPLQRRVHTLFHQSLAHFGVLGLGLKESLRTSQHAGAYAALAPAERLYRRVDGAGRPGLGQGDQG